MLKIRKSEKEELRRLNEIYSAAFESNPCPPNLIEEDEDDNEPDMLPEIAMCDPTKNRFELFDDKGDLIGGAVLDASDSAINVLKNMRRNRLNGRKWKGQPGIMTHSPAQKTCRKRGVWKETVSYISSVFTIKKKLG